MKPISYDSYTRLYIHKIDLEVWFCVVKGCEILLVDSHVKEVIYKKNKKSYIQKGKHLRGERECLNGWQWERVGNIVKIQLYIV